MHEELRKNIEKIFYLREISQNKTHKNFLEELKAINIDVDKISYSEFHVLNIIAENAPIKVTDIGIIMSMTRGAISKVCNKLLKRKLIERKDFEDNKKEVRYMLSMDGEKAYQLHKQHIEESRRQMEELLSKYNEDEKQYINNIIVKLIHPIVQL